MPIDTGGMRQILANAYIGAAVAGALHSADPAGTGAAEITVAPTVRQTLAWTAGTTGSGTASATYSVASGQTPAWTGIWSSAAAGGGVYRDKADIPDQPFMSQGTLTVSYTFTQL